MKILAFVDLHGSRKALDIILAKAKQADLIACAGDLTIFGADLDGILFELNKLKKPVLIIHGNHEMEDDLRKVSSLFDNIQFIHNKIFYFNECLFFGYGSGGFANNDPNLSKVSEKIKNKIREFAGKKILVTHPPPYNTNADVLLKEHCGNKTIAKFIKEIGFDLAICGHFHENAGAEGKIGRTLVINPGHNGKILEV